MRRTDKLWLGLLFSFLLFVTASVWADSNNPVRITGAQTPGDCVQISSTNVLSDSGAGCGGGGGGSVAIAASTSNINYYALFATNTSSSASTIFIDKASPFTYNPSTGVSSFLGLVTTSLTDNGAAALKGTTTITSAQILAGNATLTALVASTVTAAAYTGGNASLTGTTTLSSAQILAGNALVTTITSTTANTGTLNATSAAISGTTTTGNLTVTGACVGCTAPVLLPLSITTTETNGNSFPYNYFGSSTTGAAANGSPSWGIAASLSANTVLRFRFKMPPTLPGSGTLNLCSLCQANATAGVVKYTISDGMIAVNNTAAPSSTALTSETQTSITWSAADNYVETCTPLTPTPVVNQVSAGGITFNTTGWTLAQILSCNFSERWQ